jgi:hypothetical protein
MNWWKSIKIAGKTLYHGSIEKTRTVDQGDCEIFVKRGEVYNEGTRMNWYNTLKTAAAEHYYPKLVGVLQKYNGQGLYIHFSNVAKIGVNPSPSHSDPVGIYFFPLDYIYQNFAKYTHWAFRKYIFVCRLTPKSPMNLSGLSENDVDSHLQKLNMPRVPANVPYDAEYAPGRDLWHSIEKSHEENPANWKGYQMPFRRSFMQLGADSLHDQGSSIIHSNEPNQVIVLDPKIIQVVEMVQGDTDSLANKSNQDDSYYKNPKHPFYSQNTRPVIEMLNSLSSAIGCKPASSPSGSGKGNWTLKVTDQNGSPITLSINVSRGGARDYKSFVADFHADWYSNGRHCDLQDREAPDAYGHQRNRSQPFDINSEYDQIVAAYATKLKGKLAEQRPDNRSLVQSPLFALGKSLGTNAFELYNPAMGSLTKNVGKAILKINLQYQPDKGGYKIGGDVKLPKNSLYYVTSVSFNQMDNVYSVDELTTTAFHDIADFLFKTIHETYSQDPPRYFGMSQFVQLNVTPVIELLTGMVKH